MRHNGCIMSNDGNLITLCPREKTLFEERQQQSGVLRSIKRLCWFVCLFVLRNHLTGGGVVIPGQITTVARRAISSSSSSTLENISAGRFEREKLIKTSSFSRFCLFERHPKLFALACLGKRIPAFERRSAGLCAVSFFRKSFGKCCPGVKMKNGIGRKYLWPA